MRHLKAFHIFHIAAHSSTYSEAASKLNITHGAVSKQIKVLEAYLGQALFEKQGRNVCLTDAGELLSGFTEQAFLALDTGVSKLQQVHQKCLEVSCEPTLTMRWLMPRLSEFHHESGGDVRLSTAGGPVTLGSSGLSLAIRRDDFSLLHDYPKTSLVEEYVGPVMSPKYWDYIQQEGESSHIKLLHSDTRPHAWQQWKLAAKTNEFKVNPQQSFAHFYFSIQAAVDGLGAAMGSYPLVMDDLKRGNLVAPFGFVPSGHKYILLRQNKASEPLEAAFIEWLQKQFMTCIPTPKKLVGWEGE
ncbi:LysR family transcriptional regulator [Vibrio makurazakiensis]|uniref:LysR family transcriptional regulator n=1 Tax=Vibrio makurazakiensis TaxID=2910250 RepID=UPI003D107347